MNKTRLFQQKPKKHLQIQAFLSLYFCKIKRMKFLFASLSLFYSFTCYSEIILLSLGEKRTLTLSSDKVIHVGHKEFLSISTYNNQLHLLGKKEGQTFLILGSKNHKIIVLKEKIKKHLLLLDQKVKQTWGLSWMISKKNIIQITGQLNRMYDWVQIAKLAKNHNIKYEFIAQPGEDLEPVIVAYFKSLFKNHTSPEIQWSKLPLTLIPKETLTPFYQKKLSPFGLTIQNDEKWFTKSPFIEIEIALLETNNSSSLFFGNNHTSKEEILPFSSLLKLLNLLKTSGKGKTIHHSSVLAQNGQEVHIHNGGEIPFSQYNSETKQHSTQWKSYGLNLRITALLDKKETIELKIKGEISEPLSLLMKDEPPPIKSQTLQTTIKVKNKEIVKIYHQKKEGQGTFSKGGLDFSFSFLNSIVRNNNRYKTSQMILLYPKIIKKESHEIRK